MHFCSFFHLFSCVISATSGLVFYFRCRSIFSCVCFSNSFCLRFFMASRLKFEYWDRSSAFGLNPPIIVTVMRADWSVCFIKELVCLDAVLMWKCMALYIPAKRGRRCLKKKHFLWLSAAFWTLGYFFLFNFLSVQLALFPSILKLVVSFVFSSVSTKGDMYM